MWTRVTVMMLAATFLALSTGAFAQVGDVSGTWRITERLPALGPAIGPDGRVNRAAAQDQINRRNNPNYGVVAWDWVLDQNDSRAVVGELVQTRGRIEGTLNGDTFSGSYSEMSYPDGQITLTFSANGTRLTGVVTVQGKLLLSWQGKKPAHHPNMC